MTVTILGGKHVLYPSSKYKEGHEPAVKKNIKCVDTTGIQMPLAHISPTAQYLMS